MHAHSFVNQSTRTSVALEAYELLLTKPTSDSAVAAASAAKAAARSRQGTATGGPVERGQAGEVAGEAGVIMSATALLIRQAPAERSGGGALLQSRYGESLKSAEHL